MEIKIKIQKPQTCSECPCSCQIPQATNSSDWDGDFFKILCRIDFKEHVPFDENCALEIIH